MSEFVKVAIIGGGPAGLAAALALAKEGIENVCVLERESEIGGAPRHCGHPSFGVLPFKRLMTGPGFARKMREKCAGLDIRLHHSVTALHPGGELSVATPNGNHTIKAERVIIATGARETPRSARLISGMRPVGVTTTGALQQYVYLRGLKPFTRPVIIGSETVSFSALWTMFRHGIRPVAMIEPEKSCQFYWPSQFLPRILGIGFYSNAKLISINGIEKVESITILQDGHGEKNIACDGVLFTGIFTSENALIKNSYLDLAENAMGPRVDQHLQCSDPAYFAAGNMLHPADMGDRCFMEGRRVAGQVIRSLRNPASMTGRRVSLVIDAPISLIAPSAITLGNGDKTVNFKVKAEPDTSGNLIFRQNGKVLLRQRMCGHADRFTKVNNFNISGLSSDAPLEVMLEQGKI